MYLDLTKSFYHVFGAGQRKGGREFSSSRPWVLWRFGYGENDSEFELLLQVQNQFDLPAVQAGLAGDFADSQAFG